MTMIAMITVATPASTYGVFPRSSLGTSRGATSAAVRRRVVWRGVLSGGGPPPGLNEA